MSETRADVRTKPQPQHADDEKPEPLTIDPTDAAKPDDAASLFHGWPDPDFVLFITGRQHGYIEPCGCTGLANQKGGLARRHTLHRQLAERGWNPVAVDLGNQVRRTGRQAEIKFHSTVSGLKSMNYQAVAFGTDDLRLSVGELIAATADTGDGTTPFICANVTILDPALTLRFRTARVQGKKIGITAVLGGDQRARIANDEITVQPPEEALGQVWPQLEAERCDLYVLLAHTTPEKSKRLAQQFPGFDVVVSAGEGMEPPAVPMPVPGTESIVVQTGGKGMYVGVVGVFSGEQPRLRYQRVSLDHRLADSAEMLQLLASYQSQLEALGLEGLGISAIPHTSGHTFVGSQACGECHTQAFEIWQNTPHAHATDSLVYPNERSEIPRHFDPECLSCHVTGWNPQKFFPYETGYLGLKQTPLVHQSGCENCHGPGSAHVAAENGDVDLSEDEIAKLRLEMRLPLAQAERRCIECHDLDNSPDFHKPGAFEKYWAKVEHYGKD